MLCLMSEQPKVIRDIPYTHKSPRSVKALQMAQSMIHHVDYTYTKRICKFMNDKCLAPCHIHSNQDNYSHYILLYFQNVLSPQLNAKLLHIISRYRILLLRTEMIIYLQCSIFRNTKFVGYLQMPEQVYLSGGIESAQRNENSDFK